MSKKPNAVWRFFASVKLALITLFLLASTSIFGTLIKQGQAPAYYVQEYGPKLARLFAKLGLTSMYGSWWYLTILGLFAINLLVCSLHRLPSVWRAMTQDNLAIDPGQLEMMRFTQQAVAALAPDDAEGRIRRLLTGAGWKKPERAEREGMVLFFAQKGGWSRLGVYVVHLSILIILLGVLVGTLLGFQAYVYLPEGRSTNQIFLRKTQSPVPLGFDLQCDRFRKSFYPNGIVKEYRADLTVTEPGLPTPFRKSVIVNDPLSYRGLTFYVGDSYPLGEFLVSIKNQQTGLEQEFRIPAKKDVAWPGTKAAFRIEQLEQDKDGVVSQAKIRFSAGAKAEPSVFWIKNQGNATIPGPGNVFTISFRQLSAVLLLIKKDPGIPIVYAGCLLMMVGLIISFFMSHQRLWVQIAARPGQGSQILLSGTANKHQGSFEQRFDTLAGSVSREFEEPRGGRRQAASRR